jgi:DNA invertase Pin-like site-specific DNA recombinase
LQRDALTEAGCQKIFTEQMSGAVTDRPALHDALEFARSGDTLIVWKLDRLARSMKQLIETIENLRLRGIGFRSRTEALDTTTAQGRPVLHMFGVLAEFERSLIRERTRAGLAAARRAGSHRRPSAEVDGGRPSRRASAARQSRHRCNSNRATARRLSRDALSLHPRLANREYRAFDNGRLPQRPDAQEGFQPGGGRRLGAGTGRCLGRCAASGIDPNPPFDERLLNDLCGT